MAPILGRLQITSETWVDCIQGVGRWFDWAVGKEKAIVKEREQSGQLLIGVEAGLQPDTAFQFEFETFYGFAFH